MNQIHPSTIAILLILFLCNPFFSVAQDTSWGVGFLRFPYGEKCNFPLYNAPNGDKNSLLTAEERSFGFPEWTDASGQSPRYAIPQTAYEKISMDEVGFFVYKEQDGFIKLMFTSSGPSYWASLAEIEKAGAVYQPWIRFITDSKHTFYTVNYGMNVRESPGVNAKKILTVKGDNFKIEPTGSTQGNWAEVIIREYEEKESFEEPKLKKEFRGWMKVVDNEGFPNIWCYIGAGC